jgi:hypothetical protein
MDARNMAMPNSHRSKNKSLRLMFGLFLFLFLLLVFFLPPGLVLFFFVAMRCKDITRSDRYGE